MEKNRVYCYCRVANDDHLALEQQAAQLQRYARQAGYTIIGISADLGGSLKLDRPALQRVTKAVMDGKVDIVLVNSIDRIARQWGLRESYTKFLTENKVKLVCVKDRLIISDEGVSLI